MSHRNLKPVDYQSLFKILNEVCDILELSPAMVKSSCRKEDYAICREIVAYIAKETTQNSLKTIGKFLGGRDHTTIIYNLRVVDILLETNDEKFMKRWSKIIERSQIWKSYKPAA